MDARELVAHESELYGTPVADESTRFGYSWIARTFGLEAVKVVASKLGVQSIEVTTVDSVSRQAFTNQFVSSKNVYWLKLLDGEHLTAVLLRESDTHDRITSVRLETDKRCSQWYGSGEGMLRKIEAPAGFFIGSIHGVCEGAACRNLGAYFVPLALEKPPTKTADRVYRSWKLERTVNYQRYLEVTDDPLEDGLHVLALTDDELITGLRACVTDNRISSLQFETTLRTTEWFGLLPGADDMVVQSLGIMDEPGATHIGGIFAVHGQDHVKSITVTFYQNARRAAGLT